MIILSSSSIILSLILTNCGFKPIYNSNNSNFEVIEIKNKITNAEPGYFLIPFDNFIGNKKICIYNTVRGQEKITLKKKNLSCPLNLNKNF